MCFKRLKIFFKENRDYKSLKSEQKYFSKKYNEEMKRAPKPTGGMIQTRNINMDRQKKLKEYNNKLEKINLELSIISEKRIRIRSKIWKYTWPILAGIIIFIITWFLNKIFLKIF